eukprot:3302944-Prymnesium_polylepis.1
MSAGGRPQKWRTSRSAASRLSYCASPSSRTSALSASEGAPACSGSRRAVSRAASESTLARDAAEPAPADSS